jgi:Na+/phosphate symporter
MAVAWAHLIFNLSMAAVMLVLLRLFAGWTLDDWPFAPEKRKT